MAKKEKEKHLNAKQKAYEKKEEQKGRRVVNMIFGGLVALAIIYAVWVLVLM